MNYSDVARLLVTITVLDPRLSPPSPEDAKARVAAWHAVLDADLQAAEAEQIVISHYRDSGKGIMPADINRHWRILKSSRAEAARAQKDRQDRDRAAIEAVPMPEQVRNQIRRITQRSEENDA